MIAVLTQDPTTKNITKTVIEDVKVVERENPNATDKDLKNEKEDEAQIGIQAISEVEVRLRDQDLQRIPVPGLLKEDSVLRLEPTNQIYFVLIVGDQVIFEILALTNVLEKKGPEKRRETRMNGPKILSHRLETETGKKKEIPDRHKGIEILHRCVVILQSVPVALQLEIITGVIRGCRIYTTLDKEFLSGQNQTDWQFGWPEVENLW